MSAFLSYAAADRKVAEQLKDELGKSGIPVWSDTDAATGEDWRNRIEEAIHAADEILVLVGPKNGDDPLQQLTWRAALEVVWQNSSKRLIPILLGGAAPPPFIYSAAPKGQPTMIRLDDRHKVKDVAREIAELIRGMHIDIEVPDDGRETPPATSSGSNSPDPNITTPGAIVRDADEDEEKTLSPIQRLSTAKRDARLSEIREYAELLKSRPSRP